MREFKKILCPVDLDDISPDSLSLTRNIAERNGATVHLLTVVAARLAGPSEAAPGWQSMLIARLRKVGRDWFGDKVPYETVLAQGDPAAAIVHAAVQLGTDLIVLATHGRKGFDRLVLGSVAERVVRESPKPVLTVRPQPA